MSRDKRVLVMAGIFAGLFTIVAFPALGRHPCREAALNSLRKLTQPPGKVHVMETRFARFEAIVTPGARRGEREIVITVMGRTPKGLAATKWALHRLFPHAGYRLSEQVNPQVRRRAYRDTYQVMLRAPLFALKAPRVAAPETVTQGAAHAGDGKG